MFLNTVATTREKTMRFLLVAGAALLLAGCGPTPDEQAAANAANAAAVPAPTPVAMLGTVNIARPVRAFGTEPYWTLDLAPGEMSFVERDVENPPVTPFYPVAPAIAGDTATWTTRNPAGEPVVVTLTAKECLEAGEPEDAAPLTAEVKIGARTLHGCAGPKPPFQPVAEPPAKGSNVATAP
jgi:uncharacterized membrane protein